MSLHGVELSAPTTLLPQRPARGCGSPAGSLVERNRVARWERCVWLQAAESPAIEEEWLASVMVERGHGPDDEVVIAGRYGFDNAAAHHSRCAGDKVEALLVTPDVAGGKGRPACRKCERDIALSAVENAHSEFSALKCGDQRAGSVTQRHQHEQWIERNRRERVEGHPRRLTVYLRGHDGDPGRELPDAVAERAGIDRNHRPSVGVLVRHSHNVSIAMSRSDPSALRLPRIGISAYWRPVDFGPWRGYPVCLVPQGYVDGVAAAGGLPLLVPPVPEVAGNADRVLDALDGLLLTGGEDIAPALYGAEPHEATGEPNPQRDEAEKALLQAAVDRDLPVLAVCRGAQLLNALYGGDLVQHLEHATLAAHQPSPGRWASHMVRATGGTLARLIPHEIEVSSYHHQSFGHIGNGLETTSVASDGLVEAVEDPSRRFCVGVLWHPDEHPRAGGAPLFRGLVEAARSYANQDS